MESYLKWLIANDRSQNIITFDPKEFILCNMNIGADNMNHLNPNVLLILPVRLILIHIIMIHLSYYIFSPLITTIVFSINLQPPTSYFQPHPLIFLIKYNISFTVTTRSGGARKIIKSGQKFKDSKFTLYIICK